MTPYAEAGCRFEIATSYSIPLRVLHLCGGVRLCEALVCKSFCANSPWRVVWSSVCFAPQTVVGLMGPSFRRGAGDLPWAGARTQDTLIGKASSFGALRTLPGYRALAHQALRFAQDFWRVELASASFGCRLARVQVARTFVDRHSWRRPSVLSRPAPRLGEVPVDTSHAL